MSVSFNPSIYLPHVFANITKEFIRDVLQEQFNLGVISKIECIPKFNLVDGHEYFSCFIFFDSWGDGKYPSYLLSRLRGNEQTRLKYSADKYWVICNNQSDVAFYDDPTHIDLVAYLHPDFKLDTVMTVVNGLDLGKINSIELVKNIEESYYGPDIFWNQTNTSLRDKSRFLCNTVNIRFAFWYRTKSTYKFQEELRNRGFVDVPVSDGLVWTFYSQKPLSDGNNPNVWRNNVMV
jgi:hypothetical protein